MDKCLGPEDPDVLIPSPYIIGNRFAANVNESQPLLPEENNEQFSGGKMSDYRSVFST